MYGDKLSLQYQNLLTAVGGGFALGVVYDILRFIRAVCSGRKYLLIALDILFPLFAGLVTYLISLCINYGIVRFYVVAGECLGFVIYRVTVSRYTFNGFVRVFSAVRAFFHKVSSAVFKPLRSADRFIEKKQAEFHSTVDKKMKKINLFRKIDLKPGIQMLYNKLKYSFFYKGKGAGKNEGSKKP